MAQSGVKSKKQKKHSNPYHVSKATRSMIIFIHYSLIFYVVYHVVTISNQNLPMKDILIFTAGSFTNQLQHIVSFVFPSKDSDKEKR